MYIGIDGYEANIKERVGIGRFAYEVLAHLYGLDRKNEYSIFLPNNPQRDLPKERSKWQYKKVRSKGLWTFVPLPLAIMRDHNKLDVFFSPTHYIPRFVTLPRVVSVMDLSYLYFPEMFKKSDIYKLRHWTSYSIKNSSKIITISEFTKKGIIDNYGVPEKKVVVAYPGFTKRNDKLILNNLAGKYGIRGKYILYVGTLQPRKNIIRLIHAFDIIQKFKKDLMLIIIGKKGWLYEDIFKTVHELNLQSKIKFMDYIPDHDMTSFYKNATCLVLPSLYEGFGLPVLEAMSVGTPTVISNISSLPEISDNATIYVDPKSTESIASGMERALTLNHAEKNDLIKKGYANIKRFSWEKTAATVLKTLEGV